MIKKRKTETLTHINLRLDISGGWWCVCVWANVITHGCFSKRNPELTQAISDSLRKVTNIFNYSNPE